MFTLRELLDATWDCTHLSIDLRRPDGQLIRQYEIMDGIDEDTCTTHQWHKWKQGKLVMINAKINHHGKRKKNGQTEMGWGTDFDTIPKTLLDAEVQYFWQKGGGSIDGSWIYAHLCPLQQTMEV